MKPNLGLLLLAVLLTWAAADALALPPRDLKRARELHMDLQRNRIEFGARSVVDTFRKAAADSWMRRVRVVHFGDSHVKNGLIAGVLRHALQDALGDGGYGLMFPYSAANARSPVDYETRHTGEWECAKSRSWRPKIPLGVMGMTCRTTDPTASFGFRFHRSVPESWRTLKLFVGRTPKRFVLEVSAAGRTVSVPVLPSRRDSSPFVQVRLPGPPGNFSVRVAKRYAARTEFVIYGVSLESVSRGGAIVDNVGVGATRYRAPLHLRYLPEQLAALAPALVILDYGTNDYLYRDTLRDSLDGQIRAVIDRIRQSVPTATVVLTTAQDLFYKGNNVQSGVDFSRLIRRIARQKSCALYDWFWIAGGLNTLEGWRAERLAQRDLIHLTLHGYRFKGRIMAQAILDLLDGRAPKHRPRHHGRAR